MPIDPAHEYILLGRNGATAVADGGEKFRSLPAGQLETFGHGWLVSEFTCVEDWPHWEVHPEGDELVYVLEGDVEFLLEQPTGLQRTRVQGRGLVIVYAGHQRAGHPAADSRRSAGYYGPGTDRA